MDRIVYTRPFRRSEPELVPGNYEEFVGTNRQASEIGRINEAIEAGVPEAEIINYRSKDSELSTLDEDAFTQPLVFSARLLNIPTQPARLTAIEFLALSSVIAGCPTGTTLAPTRVHE